MRQSIRFVAVWAVIVLLGISIGWSVGTVLADSGVDLESEPAVEVEEPTGPKSVGYTSEAEVHVDSQRGVVCYVFPERGVDCVPLEETGVE